MNRARRRLTSVIEQISMSERRPDFIDELTTKDIIVLTETKVDDTDTDLLETFFSKLGFTLFFKNRFRPTTHRSGGILVAIKNNLHNYCTENPTDCKACLWFTIDKSVFNIDKNILCGALYLPPESSRYSDIGLFDELENELMYLNTNSQHHVVLMGDFISRTRTMNDFISIDIELLNDINLDNAICDILEDKQTLDCLGIPTKRLSLM